LWEGEEVVEMLAVGLQRRGGPEIWCNLCVLYSFGVWRAMRHTWWNGDFT